MPVLDDAVATDSPDGGPSRPARSGTTLVLLLIGALALAAGVDRWFGHAAPWIRVERVLAVWWLVWVVVLARLLHRGAIVRDDHTFSALKVIRGWIEGRRSRVEKSRRPPARRTTVRPPNTEPSVGYSLLDALSSGAQIGELGLGCFGVLLVAAGVLLGFWLLADVVVPVLFFGAYTLVRGLLVQATRGGDEARGRWGAAIARAVVVSALYVTPLMVATALVHVLRVRAT